MGDLGREATPKEQEDPEAEVVFEELGKLPIRMGGHPFPAPTPRDLRPKIKRDIRTEKVTKKEGK